MDPRRYKNPVVWLLFSPLRNLPGCGAPTPGGYKTHAQSLSCGGVGLGLVSCLLDVQGQQISPSSLSVLCQVVRLCSDLQQLCLGSAGADVYHSCHHPVTPAYVFDGGWDSGKRFWILKEISVSSVLTLNLDDLYKFIILFAAWILSNGNKNTFQEVKTVFSLITAHMSEGGLKGGISTE